VIKHRLPIKRFFTAVNVSNSMIIESGIYLCYIIKKPA